MNCQNKRAIERSKEIRDKNIQRIKNLLNAPIEVKRKNAKMNLMVSILLIVISILLLIIKLSILGKTVLILAIVSFCVNLYLINRYNDKYNFKSKVIKTKEKEKTNEK